MHFFEVLLGGGLLGLIQWLIARHDNKHDKLKDIRDSIEKLSERIDELDARENVKYAQDCRTRILRFDDELRNKMQHSLEYFQEILRDIDYYEGYCSKHPDFKNTYAVDAVEHIKKVFRQCKDENSFI